MKSFKKIAILSTIFVAILGFFVWKYYQDKQEKEHYYNNVYTYSGDLDVYKRQGQWCDPLVSR